MSYIHTCMSTIQVPVICNQKSSYKHASSFGYGVMTLENQNKRWGLLTIYGIRLQTHYLINLTSKFGFVKGTLFNSPVLKAGFWQCHLQQNTSNHLVVDTELSCASSKSEICLYNHHSVFETMLVYGFRSCISQECSYRN